MFLKKFLEIDGEHCIWYVRLITIFSTWLKILFVTNFLKNEKTLIRVFYIFRKNYRICRKQGFCADLSNKKRIHTRNNKKKPFKREIIVNTDMVIVTHKKSCVFHNKPFYVGYSILELSKMVMYSFYYKVLKSYYPEPDSLRLLYSDTDSLLLSIETSDLLGDLKALEEVFDFSNLPSNHSLYDDSKRSKLFHFKEEFGLLPILRFVSLGSKVYSIQTVCCHDYKSHANGQCADNTESGSKIRIGGKLVLIN